MEVFKPHSAKQDLAIFSKKPIIVMACGIQSGKTISGAIRMRQKMTEHCDPSDNFLCVAPTYKIMQQSTLPEFLRIMKGCGEYRKGDAEFHMHNGGICYMRTATDPDSIVGVTNVRFVWGDEAGLYSLYFWENMQARAAFKQAQIMLTTSPYSLNWLYKELIRPIMKNPKARPDVELIQMRSNENPYFPPEYYEEKRRTMDPRRFQMMFGGEFNKLQGLVYDCFDEVANTCEPFELPLGTKVVAGVDWGTTHPFVIHVRAITPDGMHYMIAEYYETGKTLSDMVDIAKRYKSIYNIETFYCDPSQPGYLIEFNRAKLNAVGAKNDIRLGLDVTYELFKTKRFKLFRGMCKYTMDELEVYHFPDDDDKAGPNKDVKERNPVKQFDDGCFRGDMRVMTPYGYKAIRDVCTDDKVLTPLGFKHPNWAGCTGTKRVWDVNGLVATHDHRVFDGKRFVSLQYADNIAQCNMENISITMMGAITGALATKLINLTTFIGRYGWMLTALFPMAIISTIKILIQKITRSKILNVCLLPITYPCTLIREHQRKSKRIANTLNALGYSQSHGTQAKQGEHGTRNTQKTVTLKEQLKSTIATIAAQNTYRKNKTKQDFARTVVGRLIVVNRAWMTLLSYVPVVKILIRKTNILRPSLVPIHVHTRCEKIPVYNLSFENVGCYYVEGFLVSNCDALRYASVHTYLPIGMKAVSISEDVQNRSKETNQHRIERLKQRPKNFSENFS